MNGTRASNDNLALMKGENSAGITKGKFMKNFNDWKDWHGEEDHLGIESGTKDFLELGEASNKDKILTFKDTLNVSSDQVDSVTGKDGNLFCVEFFDGIGDCNFSNGIFGKISGEKHKIGIKCKIFQSNRASK